MSAARGDTLQPAVAGVVQATVGFAGTFALVLTGLRAVGASEADAASGLLVICLAMGVIATYLALRTRMPVAIAWSTPGAALLLSTGAVDGGYAAAVGAFLVCGLLIILTGASARLAELIAAIPGPIASAMLAGVLLPICIKPAEAMVDLPGQTAPVLVVWLVLLRFARRWAVPGAIVTTGVVIALTESISLGGSQLIPEPTWTTPAFDLGAIVGLGLPLFLVTMASQNITGMAVLGTFGYRPPLRPILVSTGGATVLTAPFGVFAINLAAISAALMAGPEGGPDRERRWVGGIGSAAAYVVLGLSAGAAATILHAAPPLLIEAAAGIALLGPLAAALSHAMAGEDHREAAAVTLVISASGITAFSVSAPFWGLIAGLAFALFLRPTKPNVTSAPS
ncbi:MAG: benzoate/H(+) symporter BenE family transporter [Solirubrobacteraceae bacterium]|nr:benzoate/H(+) symporter BenE family transporter [Solirubrobacteraceae bacterium]